MNRAQATRLLLSTLLAAGLAACSNRSPYSTSVGALLPGASMNVRIDEGSVTAYAPAVGEPVSRFTVAATAKSRSDSPAPPAIHPQGKSIRVVAGSLDNLLLRVPRGVNLRVDSRKGDVSVTDIDGNADVRATAGTVRIMLNGYAQATVGKGSLNVTMGATKWPGTLRFGADDGDVVLFVNENAPFHLRMHTGNGTLFSDFDVRGTSQGVSETIDANVNGGGLSRIDVEVGRGTIRLLRLHPQA